MMNLMTLSVTGGKHCSSTMSYFIHYLSIMQSPSWTFYDIFFTCRSCRNVSLKYEGVKRPGLISPSRWPEITGSFRSINRLPRFSPYVVVTFWTTNHDRNRLIKKKNITILYTYCPQFQKLTKSLLNDI